MRKLDFLINQIIIDKKTKNRILLITLIMALFVLALILKTQQNNSTFIEDDNGNLTEIVRKSDQETEDYYLNLQIVNGETVDERSVTINKRAASDANASIKQADEENKTIAREAEISSIITDIELSGSKKIKLPRTLSDGSRLIWSLKKEGINNAFLIIVVYTVLILLTIISGDSKSKDDMADVKKSIIRGLPRFTNQLLLMLNAGVILSDAFDNICNSYKMLGLEGMDIFQQELIEINEANKEHRISTAILINRYAGKRNVKELMRISTILLENERRGSNIIENLNRESKYLWDDRKIVARERGKMIDTRMSYPMGLLLLILIVVTMTPALLNL